MEALREKLREKAKEQLRMVEQRNNITESRAVLSDIPQRGLSVEAAAWPPMNETPELKCVPGIKQKSARMVADIVNAAISAETPIPVQPAPTTPPTAAEGDGGTDDSTPEVKQPVQSATPPRRPEGAYQRMLKKRAEDAQRQAENQHDDMDWLPSL